MFSPIFIRTLLETGQVLCDRNIDDEDITEILDTILTLEKERIITETKLKLDRAATSVKNQLKTLMA